MASKKFNASAIGGAVAVVLMWGLEILIAPIVIPAAVSTAVGVITMAVISYVIPDELEE